MPNLNNYAKALLDISIDNKEVLQTFNDFDTFFKLTKENPEWLKYTEIVSNSKANSNIDKLPFESKSFSGFLKLIIKDHLVSELAQIKQYFFDLADEYLKQAYVEVLVSKNITDQKKAVLNKKISEIINHKKVIISYKLDPNLISGYKIRYMGGEFDMSINSRLEKLFFNI